MKRIIPFLTAVFLITQLLDAPLQAQYNTWIEMEPMPTPRGAIFSAVLDGKIYVIGGAQSNGSVALKTVEVYDPVTDTWETKNDYPLQALGSGAETINGTIYTWGGSNAINTSAQRHTKVFSYDQGTDTWTEIGQIPFQSTAPGTAVLGDRIYSMAGLVANQSSARLLSYDPDANEWSLLQDLTTRRALGDAATVGGKVFYVGGISSGVMGGAVMDSLIAYDPVQDHWSILNNMPQPRYQCSAAAYSDRTILVMPGYSEAGSTNLRTEVLAYNTSMNEWEECEEMPAQVSDYEFIRVVNDDGTECFYLIGGLTVDFWDNGPGELVSNSIWKYCPDPNGNGFGCLLSEVNDPHETPTALTIDPNPALDQATINYTIPASSNILLVLNDLHGRQLRVLVNERTGAGDHTFNLDLSDLSPGVYYCSLQCKQEIVTKRIIKTR